MRYSLLSSASTDLDLSLPSHAPELGARSPTFWDNTAFALYSLVKTSEAQLQSLASALEEQWMTVPGGANEHLVRVAHPFDFTGQGLKDIVEAHIILGKEVAPRLDGVPGGLKWFPTAFIVQTEDEGEAEGGLLFVYADTGRKYAMRKFCFSGRDAHSILSEIRLGDATPAEAAERFALQI